MFRQISVRVDQLLLDPNNPRCVTSLDVQAYVPDKEVPRHQNRLLEMFDTSGQSEFFNIKDLLDSFRQVGYVPIDKIVAKAVGDNKLLVIEGNRRVSALKFLKRSHDAGRESLSAGLLGTMVSLPILELVTENVPPEELRKHISILLGLRHHGSLLEWEPLPKAFNIYKTYLALDPPLAEFTLVASRRQDVAGILAVPAREVTAALRTYVAFRQLRSVLDGVRDHHYSLIEAAVTERRLNGFISTDPSTFKLTELSIAHLDQVCQFSIRDSLSADQRVIRRPQAFSLLGRLKEKAETAQSDVVRSVAERNLREVVAGEIDPDSGLLRMSLETALNNLTDLERRTEWVAELERLLDKMEEHLDKNEFRSVGNDLIKLEALKKALVPLQRILGMAS
jgi:hypothetical protein